MMFERQDKGELTSIEGARIDFKTVESTGGPKPTRPLLLCLSHLRWDFVFQRPQHILSRAARDMDVIVVEEPLHAGDATPRLDLSPRHAGVRVAVPTLPTGMTARDEIGAQRRLLDGLLAREGRRPSILWYYTPMAMAFSDHVDADITIYDNMDELSAFRGASPDMLAHEASLFARADIVFTGGMSLYEAKRSRHPNVVAFPSSIDAAHFSAARTKSLQEPDDQATIPHPRLGFFGVIDERMDLDLVAAIAARRPNWSVVMVGPIAKIEPISLPRAPNLHWLGPKTYDELPAYLAGWDVGLMPFALNESTRFISPTKTPEFLAAGVPVVSSAIADVVRPYGEAGLVAIGRDADDFVTLAEAALLRSRAPWLAAVDRHLASGSWDKTWADMHALINNAASRPRRAPAP